MTPFPTLSLNSRLWLVLAITILPLFVLALYDRDQDRKVMQADIDRQARLALSAARVAEAEVVRQVESILKIMAGANDLHSMNSADCSGLASRLMKSDPDLRNLGGVTPTGDLFCSGVKTLTTVNVLDRNWFKEAIRGEGMTPGEYATGRVSQKQTLIFGYPMRTAEGELRAVLFASKGTQWFERFTQQTSLPTNWSILLMTEDGLLLSGYPNPGEEQTRNLSDAGVDRLKQTLQAGGDTLTTDGFDGIERLFTLSRLSIADQKLIVAVGAPIEATYQRVERAFFWRLFALMSIVALSLVVARLLLRELVDRGFVQTLRELRLLRHALDYVPAYIYLKDKYRRYVYANKVTLDLFGVSEKELRGSPDSRFFPVESETRIAAIDARVLNGEPSNELVKVKKPDALAVYHEIKAPIYEEDDSTIWGICGISTDITKTYFAEESIRKLSRAIEQSPECIIFTNIQGDIEYVNDAFTEITGYPRDEVIGRNPRLLQSGNTPRSTYAEMWSTLKKGEVWRGEFFNRTKSGRDFTELATISPIRQSNGEITHYVAVKLDVTEARHNERELEAYRHGLEQLVRERTYELAVAKELAESASRAKSVFLANMSHEIRTPMNAISGLNYLLLKSGLTPDQADKVRKVSAAAEHLLQIISDILDLSKIEAGKLELENTTFSPKEALDGVADLIRSRVEQKGLALVVDPGNLPDWVTGDVMRLRQILLNFAGNAIKFTEQGCITLSGRSIETDDGIRYRFAVIDTGIGIRADQIPRLFKPFEQIDASTARRYGGTGLGLAIAHHLCQLMGGKIGVDSELAKGSQFWVDLPFTLAASAPVIVPDRHSTTPLRGHILLVEDEPINREIALELLTDLNLDVTACADGQQAVDWVNKAKFDLILMDLQMPVLDGLGAARKIRQLPGGEDIPIIALSANAFIEDRNLALDAGMDDFLSKPVNPEKLQEVLAHYLNLTSHGSDGIDDEAALTLDEETLQSGLANLLAQLEHGNFAAVKAYSLVRHALRQRHPGEFPVIEAAIEAYDFERARQLISALRVTETP